MIRCINLDWLECCCLEPKTEPRDVDYFTSRGIVVKSREYGTPVYEEMFSLLDGEGHPWLEIRRRPKSTIMEKHMCHLRLTNYACYRDNAADIMADFIKLYGYVFLRISRVDICYDFEKFDSGDNPRDFVVRYLNGTYSKINQANLTAHGADRWDLRDWNSLSWGSQTSDVGTKMYNKTLELYDEILGTYKKPYIRYAWQRAGLLDDWLTMKKKREDGTEYTPQIWRVEFSIKSGRKSWFEIELDGYQRTRKGKQKHLQSVPNTLDIWRKENLCVMYASLARHYFRFKYYQAGVRKDRCEDKTLFRWKNTEHIYKLGNDLIAAPTRADRPMVSLLNKIRAYKQSHQQDEVRQACDILIRIMENENTRAEINSPFRREEIMILRQTIAMKSRGNKTDSVVLMNEIRELLRMNERTCPVFGEE